MNNSLYVIRPKEISDLLDRMLQSAIQDNFYEEITDWSAMPDFHNKKLLIAVELNEAGYCLPILKMISELYKRGKSSLEGASAALLVHSANDLNTKSAATDIIFQLNMLGCHFPGHPLVEAVYRLDNFKTWQKTLPQSLEEICLDQAAKLVQRLMEFNPRQLDAPYIVALHSSSSHTSNTLALWNKVKTGLTGCKIEELHVENGTVMDCKGCSFKTCLHYSKQSSCFYGGVVVEEIYPAIEKADAVVWICPNYNDAVSANVSAVINRLTALYRKTSFSDKALFAVVVSGNSGSDSVAMQLLDSLCINKGFYLPGYFCIMATANDPGAIHTVENIDQAASLYAANMSSVLQKKQSL